ncbi:MAG: hypothetical protein HDR15_02915 [Lachnospiraceae bacterium]|nr:hypothetical protein [Lachnospiraceae bacterium]
MIIDFFWTEDGFDKRAIKGGVYHVELKKKGIDDSISLYIGESVWIARRCGRHLYVFDDKPELFGLEDNDKNNDDLMLKFSVLEGLDLKKDTQANKDTYKKTELKYIDDLRPVTQSSTSDIQIKNIEKRKKKVQDKMKELGFK